MNKSYVYHYSCRYNDGGSYLSGLITSEKICNRESYLGLLDYIENEIDSKEFIVLSLTTLHEAEDEKTED